MSQSQVEIQLIASVVAVACALLGVFLVLRRLALMSDAISHATLLGIVLAFFVVRNLSSPLLIVGAAGAGLLTVSLIEVLHRTGRVKEDAAIGLVYPLLFSIGVILVTRNASAVHLDAECMVYGELERAHYDRLEVAGRDLGPQALYLMGFILLLNGLFISLFYKELKLATFDAALAAALGFSPVLLHYGLMTLVSVTAVGAFKSVGSILGVALMIAPPAAAYLLTDRLSWMLVLSALLGVASAVGGYWLAHFLDANIAGAMATMAGILFLLVYLTAPQRGLIALGLRRLRQRWEFAQTMLAIHLLHHQGRPEAEQECRADTVHEHLSWRPDFAARVVGQAERNGLITRSQDQLMLTPDGQTLARQILTTS